MAPPPKYIITRKLVKHFFQKHLPKTPILQSNEAAKLMECWRVNGIDSPKCEEFVELYHRVSEKTRNYKTRVKSLNLEGEVLSHLSRPLYKNMKKGRFNETPYFKQRDLFDGLF